jgi:hypothetical protein
VSRRGEQLVRVNNPGEVLRMLGQLRGRVMASRDIPADDREYLLPRIDSCLEAFRDGLADEVRNAGFAELERLDPGGFEPE